jgi:hypothetical protein
MSIADFIRDDVLRPRLTKSGCLVVYDPDGRYRKQCLDLASDTLHVVDASDSSIESRQASLEQLRALGQTQRLLEGLVVYVPRKRPDTDQEKQADPFALYGACGSIFPDGDGDEYLSICLRAKPDYATEIRKMFVKSSPPPPYAAIDALGSGLSWPQLRATLGVESGREILSSLLAPTITQAESLKDHNGWMQEARDFFQAAIGMTIKTKSKSWSTWSEELWRYVLFSEFVFDLPEPLPPSLTNVPHAPIDSKPIVEGVCDLLRNDPRTRALYIDRAEGTEAELNLVEICAAIEDLGERDTFPFEERTFLRTAIKGITSGDTDSTRRILARHGASVWLGKGESQAQWDLVRAALGLVEACDDLERQLPEHSRSQSALIDFYLGSLREADRLQREFEQAVGDWVDQNGLMADVVGQARSRYRRLAEKTQVVFMKHLETAGWPPSGRVANAEVFDRLVAGRLKESGRRVAYILVDALRYELGVALERILADDGPIELQSAFAQLPTITPVGMASLLPGAGAELSLAYVNESLVPKLAGATASNVSQRMDVFRKRFGDRFYEMTLADFTRGKPKIGESVDLLVLRSTEIDSHLESNPETTLALIPNMLRLVRSALHKLRAMGFTDAIIVTDHGFFLNAHAEAGDVCAKPQGNWRVNAHDRMMLGDGTDDGNNLMIGTDKIGVRGDFTSAAMPRTMAPYRAGHLYFHGGASLAEAVVPVLIARLDTAEKLDVRKVSVALAYKNGASRITTRLPVIDVTLESTDLFLQAASLEIQLEAHDSKGNVVGEPSPGGDVNPATRTITLMPNQTKRIALRIDEAFRGKFTVKTLNPTTLAVYQSLNLETDYTE